MGYVGGSLECVYRRRVFRCRVALFACVVCVCGLRLCRRSSSRLEEELAGLSKVRMKRDLRDVGFDML